LQAPKVASWAQPHIDLGHAGHKGLSRDPRLPDVSTTTIYTHVLKVAAGGTASPLDALSLA